MKSGNSIGLSHRPQDRMEMIYSLFLLAAFGAIAVVIISRRQLLKVQDHEIQSQALFVGGASEAPEPRVYYR